VSRSALARELRSPVFGLFAVTVACSLVRVRDQPAMTIRTASIVPSDLLLAVLAIAVAAKALRGDLDRRDILRLSFVGVFAALVLVTAFGNGRTAFLSGSRVVELTILTLAGAVLVRAPRRLEALDELLLGIVVVADVIALVHWATTGGGRQNSFLGEHDYAALATLPLLSGLALLHGRRPGRRAWVAIGAGALGCILGGALASLLGFYVGAAASLLVAWLRGRVTWRLLVTTASVAVAVTAGTVGIRPGELGFIPSWLGKQPSHPGQYAGSWSQRLIYTYIGGRVLLDHPLLGTGWYGELPPKVFDRYLPAARRRFSDQPPSYFPPANEPYIPQQTFDEILYELGIVGALSFAVLIGSQIAAAIGAAKRRPGVAGVVPGAWLAAMLGALAGEALWGGTAVATLFFLVAGIVIGLGSVRAAPPEDDERRLDENRDVEPDRPVLEVVEVEPHQIVERQVGAAGHLPDAGDAG
jgi:hypothetical protein